MQAKFKLRIGQDEFELNFDVKDEKDFFEQVSFYSGLPKTAPGGTNDLKIAFRTTREGHKYYSLVSEKEKMEFKLGQNKEAQGGGLFPKGWERLFEGENSQQTAAPVQQAAAPIIAPQVFVAPAAVQQAAAPVAAPVQQAPAFVAPMPAPIPQPMAAPIQPTPAATPAAAAPAANPQVTAVANNVLARFGINK